MRALAFMMWDTRRSVTVTGEVHYGSNKMQAEIITRRGVFDYFFAPRCIALPVGRESCYQAVGQG